MQGKSAKTTKKHASTPGYVSPNQLTLAGFETPFAQKLTTENRWVKMADAIPCPKDSFGGTKLLDTMIIYLIPQKAVRQ